MMLRIVAVSIAIIAAIGTAQCEFTALFVSGALFYITHTSILEGYYWIMNLDIWIYILRIINIELLTLIRLSKKGSFVKWTVMIFRSTPLFSSSDPNSPGLRLCYHFFLCFLAKKFKVTVHTGGRTYAGTDAKVHITLYGKSSKCGPLQIDDPKDNFEANA